MKVELTSGRPLDAEASLLAVPVFEEDAESKPSGALLELDRALEGHLSSAMAAEGFRGKSNQILQLHTMGKSASERVALVGLGSRAPREASAPGLERLRMATGQVSRLATRIGARSLAIVLESPLDDPDAVRAAVEGALLGAHRFTKYKSKQEQRSVLGSVELILPASAAPAETTRQAARLGEQVASAVAWARDLVNEPPARCTPARLADEARLLARKLGLRSEVRGPKEIASLGMGMFLAVARGSEEEPRLVTVSWSPKGKSAAGRKPLVLVGKAITFDSGGLSLKPNESMQHMNDDMAGAAAVLGAMRVVAALKPPFPVHALLGACENMPGGRAYKPSDVLTAYDGKTVEITNTDAEGRLVLGDVLAWAADRFDPAGLIDVATLTGACVVALGNFTVGTFGPDGPLMEAVLSAARASGEDLWRMPLTPLVKETLESDVADMKNSGERWGGAIAAAHFLREFTGKVPWVHLDIAGPAHSGKERGYVGKGGTGVPIRTLVELVRAWKG